MSEEIKNTELTEFYYQIKGKAGVDNQSLSCWAFPPIFSGKVSAKNKAQAKEIIEKEYHKKFSLRVLRKDLDNNEFLLKIEDMTDNDYLKSLFEERECIECKMKFRRIDLYNNANEVYKGDKFCSDSCKQIYYERERAENFEQNQGFYDSIPVIYRITNKNNNKIYIGQTTQSFTLRWWQHIKWGKSDCKFHKAMRKSKITDWIFEVIEVVKDKSKLDERESYYIKHYNSIKKGYNTLNVNKENKEKFGVKENK